ncbi:hypothetical protein TetV_407 [Tetraselmis virus 1]|uniref:Uncharacterized protein n=1 Tax=Tetraselmis virus 1 TaxID=2060617 RepID=A0A2P0VNZ3_9VIRU|nr:hypothetical protein QJ968_gp647 [Tetraselmis virus 1]AUF82489.1 hypothetical protein TetV_407 [Tetraselmis virus 1]
MKPVFVDLIICILALMTGVVLTAVLPLIFTIPLPENSSTPPISTS